MEGKENENKQPVAKRALTEKKRKELMEQKDEAIPLGNEMASQVVVGNMFSLYGNHFCAKILYYSSCRQVAF